MGTDARLGEGAPGTSASSSVNQASEARGLETALLVLKHRKRPPQHPWAEWRSGAEAEGPGPALSCPTGLPLPPPPGRTGQPGAGVEGLGKDPKEGPAASARRALGTEKEREKR